MNDSKRLRLLVEAIRDHTEFDHHIDKFDIIETHISCILLTGPYAYKFKKPVNPGFLDYSTLENRRFYCNEEVRLNKRLAPELYLDVVSFTDSEQYPVVDGSGPVLEYAVKMVQFPVDAGLDQVLKSGYFTKSHVDELASRIASFHSAVPRADADTPFGEPADIKQTVLDNFSLINPHLQDDAEYTGKLKELEQWTRKQFDWLKGTMAARKHDGYIRECHGDMHLANIIWYEGRVVIFDCIEFSGKLRWIDVISEVAFLAMDLESRGQAAFAHRFVNKYLEYTGDYGGLSLLRFYCVYRALVRAKVACLSAQNTATSESGRQELYDKCRHYVNCALHFTRQHTGLGYLIITHGLSGSGKSTVVRSICEYLSAISIRSDVERKRLSGLAPATRTQADIRAGIYSDYTTNQTYAILCELAEKIMSAGYPVIVDATFLMKKYRQTMYDLARHIGAPFIILHVQAGKKTLQRRILEREATQSDASEAGIPVLEYQVRSMQPLDSSEQLHQILVNTDEELNYLRIADDINVKLQQLTRNLDQSAGAHV
jgi:aminoglycoside phosphotransferase family enzyme/predicted kinase